jgi:hypothetical protein
MNYGFVYIIKNDVMKVFKIGCTERSPHARAAELSSGTAVPFPFDVVCYAEFSDFQSIEAQLHRQFAEYRVSQNREFFYNDCVNDAVAYLFYHPEKLSFTDVEVHQALDGPFLSANELPDPWEPPRQHSPNTAPTALEAEPVG